MNDDTHERCDNCRDMNPLWMLQRGLKCGECGYSPAYLLPEIKVRRGPIKFYDQKETTK